VKEGGGPGYHLPVRTLQLALSDAQLQRTPLAALVVELRLKRGAAAVRLRQGNTSWGAPGRGWRVLFENKLDIKKGMNTSSTATRWSALAPGAAPLSARPARSSRARNDCRASSASRCGPDTFKRTSANTFKKRAQAPTERRRFSQSLGRSG